uniref:Glycosyltransferase family 2 protein n=1 Tax=candidate division WOR-3 bacterium TaxID=2052148 RepID=A0A7C6A9X4_UNCW3
MNGIVSTEGKDKIETTLVILNYNEIEGLRKIFDQIPFQKIDEAFVVDGGSTDGSVEFLKSKGLRVITQKRKGRGEAFRIGINEAKGEFVVFFSPDGNEDPKDIVKLFDLLKQGNDMAIASRFLPGARNDEDDKVFRWRAWANRCFTFIANSVWKGKITDTINGFRGVRKSSFLLMHPTTDAFTIEYQMSIRALKLKMKVAEIATYEGDRIGGYVKAKSIPTGIRFVIFLIKELFAGRRF